MQSKILIKKALEQRNMTMTELVALLQDKGIQTSYSNLHNKLTRDTIKYSEVLEILHVIDFEIVVSDKRSKVSKAPARIYKTEEVQSKIIKMMACHHSDLIQSIIDCHVSKAVKSRFKDEIANEIANEIAIHIRNNKK